MNVSYRNRELSISDGLYKGCKRAFSRPLNSLAIDAYVCAAYGSDHPNDPLGHSNALPTGELSADTEAVMETGVCLRT